MCRLYPALDVIFCEPPSDERLELLTADLDGDAPLAIEDTGTSLRVFFSSRESRDGARARLASRPDLRVESVEVSDEDWAARSQAALTAVHVGRLVVAPPWNAPPGAIIIQPSMGFGTGHHATTRLCLRLLQDLPDGSLGGARVLDVGTGSGVLAIAAAKVGAASVLAIDNDPDALSNARENVALNAVSERVVIEHADLSNSEFRILNSELPSLILANLTGATLVRYAPQLAQAVRPGGTLIVSGMLREEADEVRGALESTGFEIAQRIDEDEWVALSLTRGC